MRKTLVRALDLVDATVSRLETVLLCGFVLLALGLGVMQVLLRYIFNTGFEWTEAIFILSTVSAMLVAGVRAVRDNRHVKVDILPSTIGGRTEQVLRLLANLASLALCVFFAISGWKFVGFTVLMDTAAPDTGIKDWVVYSIMPTAMVLFSVRYALLILTSLLKPAGTDHAGGGDVHTSGEPE